MRTIGRGKPGWFVFAGRCFSFRWWSAALGCALMLLGGCGAGCSAPDTTLPSRTTWPTLVPFTGATVTEQLTLTTGEQRLIFVTTANKDQVLPFYRSLLEPQGWSVDRSGELVEERACPKLFLRIEQLDSPATETRYGINLYQTPCRNYC